MKEKHTMMDSAISSVHDWKILLAPNIVGAFGKKDRLGTWKRVCTVIIIHMERIAIL
jgi:hypothetical protein